MDLNKMIECQYCYTRNNENAPVCQACGAPIEIQKIKNNVQCWCMNPIEPDKFIQIGNIAPIGEIIRTQEWT